MSISYWRRPDATERKLGEALFLANPEFGSLYRVNDTIAALWKLLEQPTTIQQAVDTYSAAFPDEPAAELEDHVTEMFLDLIEEGLAVEAAQ